MSDFFGGRGVKNLPASAENMALIPGPGRVPMLWATKAMHPHYWAWAQSARAWQQEKPLQREARTRQLESSPCSSQLEKAQEQQQRPRAVNKSINEKLVSRSKQNRVRPGQKKCRGGSGDKERGPRSLGVEVQCEFRRWRLKWEEAASSLSAQLSPQPSLEMGTEWPRLVFQAL